MPHRADRTIVPGIWKDIFNGEFEGIPSLNTHVIDYDNGVVRKHFHLNTGDGNTLAVAAAIDDYQITVVDGTAYSVGDEVEISNGSLEPSHFAIIAIATNLITLDRHLDNAHPIGTDVTVVEDNISTTIGTLAAPISYKIHPEAGEIWHIYRLMVTITHGTAGDLGKFGDLDSLTNGCILRASKSGVFATLTNWKSNADVKLDFYDVEFDQRAGGGGTYGTSARGTFSKLGTILELNGDNNDYLEILVQDDLTGLLSFKMSGQGHFEESGE